MIFGNGGGGFHVSIWLSGCRRHCKGCFNEEAWSFTSGKPLDENALNKLKKELSDDNEAALSILGGEPLEKENLNAVKILSSIAKSLNKKVWLWTGFYLSELSDEQYDALENVDYVIDGPFIEEKKSLNLLWRGSSNQHLFEKTPLGFFSELTIDTGISVMPSL